MLRAMRLSKPHVNGALEFLIMFVKDTEGIGGSCWARLLISGGLTQLKHSILVSGMFRS